MLSLSTIGLALDILGVVILGLDVVFLHKGNVISAASAREIINDFKQIYGQGIGGFGWRTGSVSEGLFEPDGGIDSKQAESDFKELNDAFNELSGNFDELLSLQERLVSNQEEAANRSIRLTILGMVLIIAGFILQIFSQLFPFQLHDVISVINTDFSPAIDNIGTLRC